MRSEKGMLETLSNFIFGLKILFFINYIFLLLLLLSRNHHTRSICFAHFALSEAEIIHKERNSHSTIIKYLSIIVLYKGVG
jgi:hypothetical protein